MSELLNRYKLYYTTSWPLEIGNVATEEDRIFNWFLCSKRKLKDDLYVISIRPGVKFYSEKNGRSVVVEKETCLFLLDEKHNEQKLGYTFNQIVEEVISSLPEGVKKMCSGAAFCSDPQNKICSDSSPVCNNAVFVFWSEASLKEINVEETCDMAMYAKKFNKTIKKVHPGFPSCEAIDKAFEKYPSYLVCKVLYEEMTRYASLDRASRPPTSNE